MHLAIQNLLIQARFFPSDAFSQHELLTKSFQLYVLITWRVQTFFLPEPVAFRRVYGT